MPDVNSRELYTQALPASLSQRLEKDWLLQITRSLAQAGAVDTDLYLDMDAILDQPDERRAEALKALIDRLINKRSASQSDVDIINF